jgi:XapX domain-containing protein
MNAQIALALLTGVVAGGAFAALEVPIPAPPNVAGVMGIVGLYLGYKGVEALGYSVDLLGLLQGVL